MAGRVDEVDGVLLDPLDARLYWGPLQRYGCGLDRDAFFPLELEKVGDSCAVVNV